MKLGYDTRAVKLLYINVQMVNLAMELLMFVKGTAIVMMSQLNHYRSRLEVPVGRVTCWSVVSVGTYIALVAWGTFSSV